VSASRESPKGEAPVSASREGPKGEAPLKSAPALPRTALLGIVFVTGAAVLVVEILGTRVVGPVFGVSLFVWSALLAVTLASLATGYYAGGVLVDRAPTPRLIGLVVALAGVLLALVPVLSQTVLRSAEALGPRGGPLLAATLLFTPTLIALGMVGPIAVRLATTDLRTTGHGAGAVYAMSTVGSLAGTLLTAFLLIPTWGTRPILIGTAALLTLTGAIALTARRRPSAFVALLVPAFASFAPEAPLPADIRVVDHSESLYGLLQVIDDRGRNFRLLRADHSITGAQFLGDHSAGFSFLHLLEAIQFLRPQATDMLQIGIGIGSLPTVLAKSGIRADVVEIDPAVVRFARSYFGFSTRGDTFVEDARTFLRRTGRRYDLIVHDTFTGGTTPEHLLSVEVIARIHELLRPGGVLALNFVGYENGPNAEATWAVARTLHAVFPNVRAFRDSAPKGGTDSPANLVFFASEGALDFVIPDNAHFENSLCEHVLRSFQKWEVLAPVPGGPLITDALNPLARLELPVAEAHFYAMNELLPIEVWLHTD
jgi:predicted membrane-bound spermidine synthase